MNELEVTTEVKKEVSIFIKEIVKLLEKSRFPRKWNLAKVSYDKTTGVKTYSPANIPNHNLYIRDILYTDPCETFTQWMINFKPIVDIYNSAYGNMELEELISPYTISRNIIRDYLSGTDILWYNDELSSIIGENFAQCISKKTYVVMKWAPLAGLSGEVPKIYLDSFLSIVRYDEESAFSIQSKFVDYDVTGKVWPYALEYRREILFGEEFNSSQIEEKFETAVKALRLTRTGTVNIPFMADIQDKPGNLGFRGNYRTFVGIKKIYPEPMLISGKDTERVNFLYGRIQSEEMPKSVSIAIDRICMTSERFRSEDQFIDHIIAIEALYGDTIDGLPGGLTYKIAIRLAIFLFDQQSDRLVAFKMMKKALSIRGALVHGSKSNIHITAGEREVILWIENSARESIYKILSGNHRIAEGFFDKLLLSAHFP